MSTVLLIYSMDHILAKRKTSLILTPWKSIYITSFCAFLQSLQFTILRSSMWPYLRKLNPDVTEHKYGFVNTLYNFGTVISAIVFGYWSNRIKQVRLPLFICFWLIIIGDIVYALLQYFGKDVVAYVLMISRLLTGCGVANAALLRAYALSASSVEERSKAFACIGIGIAAGGLTGSGLQLAFTLLGSDGVMIARVYQLDLYNAPALMASLLNLCGFLTILFCFEESYEVLERDSKKMCHNLPHPCYTALLVCASTRFGQEFAQSAMETLEAPFTMLMFLFEKEEAVKANSIAQLASGCCGILLYLIFFFAEVTKRAPLRFITILGVSLYAISYVVTYPWPFLPKKCQTAANGSDAGCFAHKYAWCTDLPAISPWVFYPIFVFVFGFAHPLTNICVTTIYSQVMGPRRQGTSQGLFTMAGSLGKLFAPLIMTCLYTSYGPAKPWMLEILQFCTLFVVWIVFYKRMVPMQPKAQTLEASSSKQSKQ